MIQFFWSDIKTPLKMARSAEQWKQPSCLGYVEDYTAQLCGDYKRPWHKDSYETTGTYDGKYPAVFFCLRQTVSLRVPGTNSLGPYKTNELFLLHPFFNFQGKGAEFKSFQNWMTGSMVKNILYITSLSGFWDVFFHRKNRRISAIKSTKHIPEQKTSSWKIDFVFSGCSVLSAFLRGVLLKFDWWDDGGFGKVVSWRRCWTHTHTMTGQRTLAWRTPFGNKSLRGPY